MFPKVLGRLSPLLFHTLIFYTVMRTIRSDVMLLDIRDWFNSKVKYLRAVSSHEALRKIDLPNEKAQKS